MIDQKDKILKGAAISREGKGGSTNLTPTIDVRKISRGLAFYTFFWGVGRLTWTPCFGQLIRGGKTGVTREVNVWKRNSDERKVRGRVANISEPYYKVGEWKT